MKIADLFALVGFRVDKKGQKKVDDALTRTTRRIGRVLTAMGGIWAAKRLGGALVGFNSDLEQAKIQMAGLLQLNTGGEFNEQLKVSNDLVLRLQQRAKKSVGTTKDMVDMASRIVRPVTAAKLGVQELEDITASAVVAAKAFGIEAGVAALDIEQALMGNLQKRDRFARALLEPMGFSTEKFNKLSARKRGEMLMKAMNQEGIVNMAKAQAQSFAGLWSTAWDSIQMTLGKVGMPLFKAIVDELKVFTAWIDKNPKKIDKFVKTFSAGLIKIFKIAKAVLTFVFDHWEMIITLLVARKTAAGILALSNGMKLLGVTSLRAGMQAAAGWLAALGPVLILTALVAGIIVLFREAWKSVTDMDYGDSFIGALVHQVSLLIHKFVQLGSYIKDRLTTIVYDLIDLIPGMDPYSKEAAKTSRRLQDALEKRAAMEETRSKGARRDAVISMTDRVFPTMAPVGAGAGNTTQSTVNNVTVHAGGANAGQVADQVSRRLGTQVRKIPASRRVREPRR